MNYAASVSDFFKTPKWGLSLLWGALAMLIPIAGWMLIMGWLITGFWCRQDQRYETFPPFNFDQFEKYLTRGVWPTLIMFVPILVLVPVSFVMMTSIMAIASVADHQSGGLGCLVAFFPLMMIGVIALLMCCMVVIMVPLTLRASLMQDFLPAIDLTFLRQFFRLMWKEMLLSGAFVMAVSMLLQFAGMLAFCVGVYVVPVLTMFTTMHIDKQLYALYLERGGEPIPVSPKLVDEPPPVPVA